MGFKRVAVKYQIESLYGDITVEPTSSVDIKQGWDADYKDLIVIERENLADLIDVLVEIDNEEKL